MSGSRVAVHVRNGEIASARSQPDLRIEGAVAVTAEEGDRRAVRERGARRDHVEEPVVVEVGDHRFSDV